MWTNSLGFLPCAFPCVQMHMRYKVLNHLVPGSGWDNYVCCQGYTGPCLCFTPGSCMEKDIPRTCMCVEAICCAGFAVGSQHTPPVLHFVHDPLAPAPVPHSRRQSYEIPQLPDPALTQISWTGVWQ